MRVQDCVQQNQNTARRQHLKTKHGETGLLHTHRNEPCEIEILYLIGERRSADFQQVQHDLQQQIEAFATLVGLSRGATSLERLQYTNSLSVSVSKHIASSENVPESGAAHA